MGGVVSADIQYPEAYFFTSRRLNTWLRNRFDRSHWWLCDIDMSGWYDDRPAYFLEATTRRAETKDCKRPLYLAKRCHAWCYVVEIPSCPSIPDDTMWQHIKDMLLGTKPPATVVVYQAWPVNYGTADRMSFDDFLGLLASRRPNLECEPWLRTNVQTTLMEML
jgi:hypothetical protein